MARAGSDDGGASVRVVAIVQARMGSTRLPGKVLLDLCGRTALARVLERVGSASGVDEVRVATSLRRRGDAVVEEAARCGTRCFRGSEDDVLARYHGACTDSRADVVVRVTSDCPLFDPGLLGGMLARFAALRAEGVAVDYLANTHPRTWPLGLDAEIFTAGALDRAHREAADPYEREHVTPYLYREPGRFAVHNYASDVDLSDHRWTLDTEDDYRFIHAVYRDLGAQGLEVTTRNVLSLLEERKDLLALNAHVQQTPELA